jgi:hypothetical protein
MEFGPRFAESLSGATGLLIYDPVQRYPWLIYLVVGAVYTVAVFWVWLPGDEDTAPIFSDRNAKPLTVILGSHLVFLTILLESVWFASHSSSFLPGWLTDENIVARGGRHSVLEILLIIATYFMRKIEMRKIYAESDKVVPDPEKTCP